MAAGSSTNNPIDAALRTLMEGPGATVSRTKNLAWAKRLRVYGAAAEVRGESDELIRTILYSAAVRLDHSVGRLSVPASEVALAALALGRWQASTPKLFGRLNELGSSHGTTATSTMRGYLREVTPELRKSLQTLSVEDLMESSGDGRGTDLGDDPIYEESCRIHWAYRGQVPYLYQATRVLRPRLQPLTRYTFPFGYPNVGKTVAVALPLANCDDPVAEFDTTRVHRMSVRVPTTQPGHDIRISYLISVDSDEPDQPYLRHWSFHHGERATVGILFDRDDAPDRVWVFQNESAQYSPTPGPVAAALTVPSGDGPAYVQHTFDQHVERYFGFVWEWPAGREMG